MARSETEVQMLLDRVDLTLFLVSHQDKRIGFVLDTGYRGSGILRRMYWGEGLDVKLHIETSPESFMAVHKSEIKIYGYDIEEASIGV